MTNGIIKLVGNLPALATQFRGFITRIDAFSKGLLTFKETFGGIGTSIVAFAKTTGPIAVGLVIAVGVSHALAATTEFFQAAGALTYVAIAGALVMTAAAGLLRPVRRALALQPVDALRRE